MMSTEVQQTEFTKNDDYRKRYHRVLRWLILLGFSAIAFTAVLVYMNLFPRKSQFYVTTTSGLVIPIHPLSAPVVTNKYLLQWASLATRNALNLDFVHYQQQLTSAQPYFTEGGWNSFKSALNKSGLLKTVLNKKLEMSAVVSGAPLIVNQTVLHGRYTWDVQLPVLVSFTSANENAKLKLLVSMTIQRIPVLDAAKGIQIIHFNANRVVG